MRYAVSIELKCVMRFLLTSNPSLTWSITANCADKFLGIRDRKVLAIIARMLKAPIKGEGTPTKGVPQGGILSPLLSNIVLNDLDWWLSNQWETFKTKYTYSTSGNKYKAPPPSDALLR
jgi:hypothetical protein